MSKQCTSSSDAMAIYQRLLDTISTALLAQDVETIRAHVKLPYVRRTLTAEAIVETEEDLAQGMLAYARSLTNLGVNSYISLASEAEFLSPHYIQGFHVTHALKNATRVIRSFSNRCIIQNDRGVWKLMEHDSALKSTTWPFNMLLVPRLDADILRKEIDPDDVRRTAAEPLAIYQQFLDSLTASNMAKDFDAYCSLCSFPFTSHQATTDKTIHTPEDIRPFFDWVGELLDTHKVDRFERRGERAEFISGNRLCGYHSGRMYYKGKVIVGPIRSRMILERHSTKWLLKSVTNSVTNDQLAYLVPDAADSLVTIREIQERQKQ